MEQTDVAIVGAGPNGLALAAHLQAAGVDHVILGYPFATWKDHMPRGMLLKSEPYGSYIAAPTPGYRVRDYCNLAGTEYVDRAHPLKLETFVGYGEWFAKSLVPDVRPSHVTSLTSGDEGFTLTTDKGLELTARRVVVATCPLPFAHVPALLEGLPADLVSHSSAHSDLTAFRGRRIGVVGAGQSALELAALLHEVGADVELVVRRKELLFIPPMVERKRLLVGLREPVNPLCESFPCWCYYTFPDVFRAFPERQRLLKAPAFLGPTGSAWLRSRIDGRVTVRTGARIIKAQRVANQVRLELDAASRQEVKYDHVIAGTGFRLDTERLGYLSSGIRRNLRVAGGPLCCHGRLNRTYLAFSLLARWQRLALVPRCGSLRALISPPGVLRGACAQRQTRNSTKSLPGHVSILRCTPRYNSLPEP
jgi:hypothetical protein